MWYYLKKGSPVATPDGLGCITITDYAAEEYDANPYLWYQIINKYGRNAVTEHIAKIIAGSPQSLLNTGSCETLLDIYESRIESGYKLHDLRYRIERSSTLNSALTLHRESSVMNVPCSLETPQISYRLS
jgi:hypothetical protein